MGSLIYVKLIIVHIHSKLIVQSDCLCYLSNEIAGFFGDQYSGKESVGILSLFTWLSIMKVVYKRMQH